jgi:hypothetical protein
MPFVALAFPIISATTLVACLLINVRLRTLEAFQKRRLSLKASRSLARWAEQVEKVNPDLVARDADGKVYTVRYDAVNAMSLNEFLKEHSRAEEHRKQFEAKFA